jgi:hypothetical protein
MVVTTSSRSKATTGRVKRQRAGRSRADEVVQREAMDVDVLEP